MSMGYVALAGWLKRLVLRSKMKWDENENENENKRDWVMCTFGFVFV